MAKKMKTKGKKNIQPQGNDILRKLNRMELLELLLEQTKKVEELESQLEHTKSLLEKTDSKLNEVIKLTRAAMDLVEREAERRAETKIKKAIAEGKLIKPGTKEVKKPAVKPTQRPVSKPEVKPEPKKAVPEKTAPKVTPVNKFDIVDIFGTSNSIDVAKILGGK